MGYDTNNILITLNVKCPDVEENLPQHETGTAITDYNTVQNLDVEHAIKRTLHLVHTMITFIHTAIRSTNASNATGTFHSSVA